MEKRHTFRNIFIVVVLGGIAFFIYGNYHVKKLDEYYELVNQAIDTRNASVDALNECSDVLLDVWGNSIGKIEDSKTDPYTRPDGVFLDDFNEALENLYEDPDFQVKADLISEKQMNLRKIEKKLENPPGSEEEYNEVFLEFLDNYIEVSMAVINPNGSFIEVSDQINHLNAEGKELQMELDSFE